MPARDQASRQPSGPCDKRKYLSSSCNQRFFHASSTLMKILYRKMNNSSLLLKFDCHETISCTNQELILQQPSFLWTSLSFLFLLPQLACSGNANSDNSKLENSSQQPDWDFSLESNPKQGFYCTANGQSFGHLIFHDDHHI